MNFLKSHFVFNRSQQNGIFILVIIIIILQLIIYAVDFSAEEDSSTISKEELKKFQNRIDSIRLAGSRKENVIYPFNPNYITDYKGYTLGMSTKEIDRLLEFRREGKWINSAPDFQKVTGVSDSLLQKIAPYFKFPEWVQQKEKSAAITGKNNNQVTIAKEKSDLNNANFEDLVEVKGIGETLARRIMSYRAKIGGFVDDIQLKDIYGLNKEQREALLSNFTVLKKPEISKKSINSISVLELSEVPYFNYELAREIINYRQLRGEISSFEELAEIKSFPTEKIDRIKLYLAIN